MVIKRVRADNYPLDVQLVRENGEPIPLTGCTVFFTVKRNIQDPDSRASITVDVNTFLDPDNGYVSFPLTSSQCDISGEFYYDVKIKYATGVIESVIKSTIIFVDHVTLRTS